MSVKYECERCGKCFINNRDKNRHLAKKTSCVAKQSEPPTMTIVAIEPKPTMAIVAIEPKPTMAIVAIESKPAMAIVTDIEYEYMFLYNKIHNFKRLHKSNIRIGLPVWMQNMRDVNNEFHSHYISYYFKRFAWKPTIDLCLAELKTKHREKQELIWSKNNASFNITHFNRIYCIKQSHLMTDVRDYFGYAKM